MTTALDRHVGSVAPSQAIVERVADIEGVDHTDLEPLYNSIDPDALDNLVGQTGTSMQIEFVYEGFDVTVSGDGEIAVDEAPSREH